ncbi:hypothetical protein J8273_0419 [Carpediemonas membranifera]|uniref:Uncharacterized protein n=1 Tax=Carpediemonas membranifera TaxID=201153 RepID=A0A8J6E0J2_9EUKA|nr:hypothetical protein J8273_0419 [Carpediemonas membranifera]|eukprot:KAG9395199.1 hypothetical protein J8273_0419 [Carpediemonas membranifera]
MSASERPEAVYQGRNKISSTLSYKQSKNLWGERLSMSNRHVRQVASGRSIGSLNQAVSSPERMIDKQTNPRQRAEAAQVLNNIQRYLETPEVLESIRRRAHSVMGITRTATQKPAEHDDSRSKAGRWVVKPLFAGADFLNNRVPAGLDDWVTRERAITRVLKKGKEAERHRKMMEHTAARARGRATKTRADAYYEEQRARREQQIQQNMDRGVDIDKEERVERMRQLRQTMFPNSYNMLRRHSEKLPDDPDELLKVAVAKQLSSPAELRWSDAFRARTDCEAVPQLEMSPDDIVGSMVSRFEAYHIQDMLHMAPEEIRRVADVKAQLFKARRKLDAATGAIKQQMERLVSDQVRLEHQAADQTVPDEEFELALPDTVQDTPVVPGARAGSGLSDTPDVRTLAQAMGRTPIAPIDEDAGGPRRAEAESDPERPAPTPEMRVRAHSRIEQLQRTVEGELSAIADRARRHEPLPTLSPAKFHSYDDETASIRRAMAAEQRMGARMVKDRWRAAVGRGSPERAASSML